MLILNCEIIGIENCIFIEEYEFLWDINYAFKREK